MNLEDNIGKWIQLRKVYRNAEKKYCIKLTDEIVAMFGDEECISEYVGENTEGGHNYGYSMYAEYFDEKPEGKEMSLQSVTRLC